MSEVTVSRQELHLLAFIWFHVRCPLEKNHACMVYVQMSSCKHNLIYRQCKCIVYCHIICVVSIATGSYAFPTVGATGSVLLRLTLKIATSPNGRQDPKQLGAHRHLCLHALQCKLVYNRHGNTVPYLCYEQCKQCRYISIYMAIEDVMVDVSE